MSANTIVPGRTMAMQAVAMAKKNAPGGALKKGRITPPKELEK
ncbi:hypothetical protein [Pseudoduganella buxea]|nr:hypothetical protein [Pseudoduganella buxea]